MKKYKKDIIVLASFVVIGLVFLMVLLLTKKPGTTVVVEVEGKQVAAYPLNKDATYTIQGKDGGTNQLVIKGGAAFVESASCPDGLCKNMGKIRNSAQSIICLPNQVVIKITGDQPDADIVIH